VHTLFLPLIGGFNNKSAQQQMLGSMVNTAFQQYVTVGYAWDKVMHVL
jgi:hypothetical protein